MVAPEQLRPCYARFLRDDRVLMTGHSHQAWPDVAREGLLRAFDDAALHVDDKWALAADAADAVRAAAAAQLGGEPADYALGASTHELVTRLLSALPWKTRRHIVTTEGEFHSLRRQLARLEEEGIAVTRVAVEPVETLAERLASALRRDTAALMVSTVLFETSTVVPELEWATARAHELGAEVLLDAYHHFNVVPWGPVDARAFVVAGGYKYAQWGEGCCFMRVPPATTLRPVYTGWFSDFASLGERQAQVRYGARGADRFAGSTYDPSSHYRARAVIDFFAEKGLDVGTLREISLRQTARILGQIDFAEALSPSADSLRGGFVTVRVPNAGDVVQLLRERGVYVDARGDGLRLGPAPYTTDDEIDRSVAALEQVLRGR